MIKKVFSVSLIATISFASTMRDGVIAYENGDFQKASKIFEKHSLNGNSDAQFLLGDMYLYGKGVERNSKKSKESFQKSCNNGNDASCKMLKMFDGDRSPFD